MGCTLPGRSVARCGKNLSPSRGDPGPRHSAHTDRHSLGFFSQTSTQPRRSVDIDQYRRTRGIARGNCCAIQPSIEALRKCSLMPAGHQCGETGPGAGRCDVFARRTSPVSVTSRTSLVVQRFGRATAIKCIFASGKLVLRTARVASRPPPVRWPGARCNLT